MISDEDQKFTCFKCHLKQSGLIFKLRLCEYIYIYIHVASKFHLIDGIFMHFDIDIEPHAPCRYVGHLKERSLKDQMAKDPTEVIRKAVLRMLPRNKLRDVSVIILGFSLSLIQMLYFICLVCRTLDF